MMIDSVNNSTAKRDSARRTIVDVARGMLNENIPLIEGCRSLVRLRSDAEIPPSEAFDVIVSVASDTDDYPVGSLRAEYAPELLSRLDAKVSRILAKDSPVIIEACREIIREMETLQLQSGDTNNSVKH
jgi:hypothetical protein